MITNYAMQGLVRTGFASASQSGKVTDVVAVSFSKRAKHDAPSITVSAGPIGALDRADAPVSGTALQAGLATRAAEALQAHLDDSAEVLLATGKAVLGKDVTLDDLLSDEMQDSLPKSLRAAVSGYKNSLESLSTLQEMAAAEDTSGERSLNEAERDSLIEMAIADQVDMRLEAERSMDEFRLQQRLGVLSLFGEAGERQAALEKTLMLGKEAARLGRREGMMNDMRRAIDRGEVTAQISMRTTWAGSAANVTAGDGEALSVFTADRYQFSFATLRLTGTEMDVTG